MRRESLALAIEALSWMAYTGIGERAALLKASRQMKISGAGNLRQAHKWIMETSRFQNQLDWIISQTASEDRMKDASHGVRSLFRLVAYMKFVDPKPAPELERVVGWARQTIGWRELRPYEEDLARLLYRSRTPSTRGLSEFEKLGVDTCHPAWYVRRLAVVFGMNTALKILKRDLLPVANFVRMNDLKANEDNMPLDQLHATASSVPNVYVLGKVSRADNRAELASSGKIVIQDLASIVAGLVASPQPGQVVLDICAAPGNKTSHLAAQMNNEGDIYSIELSAGRAFHWRKEMERTSCSIASLVLGDARKLPLHVQANVALVDPPCSNSGVFARNPASKWRVNPARLKELIRSQSEILEATAERLADGGTLVYCTCSILPEENELVVENFLKRNQDFKLTTQAPFVGSNGLRGLSECQRFYPHLHDCNGYFIAKLRKG